MLLGTTESAEWAFNVHLMTRRERKKVWTIAEKRMLLAIQLIAFQSWLWEGLWVYSDSNDAPLARATQKLEIWSDLYSLSENCMLSLSLHRIPLPALASTFLPEHYHQSWSGKAELLMCYTDGQPHQTRSQLKPFTSRPTLGFKHKHLQTI